MLGAALKAGGAWCAKKADLAVNAGINWGIPTVGGYFAMNPEKLEAVIEAGKALVRMLP